MWKLESLSKRWSSQLEKQQFFFFTWKEQWSFGGEVLAFYFTELFCDSLYVRM